MLCVSSAVVAAPVAAAASPQATIATSTSAALATASAPGVAVNGSEDGKKEEENERAKVRAQCVAAFRTGASYREVAEQLQLTIGTVQSHIKQARRTGELGDEAPARSKGRPRLINDAIDAMLVRIIQEKGTKSARLIQEELAKPPHNTKLSYEVVRRRVKQLIDSIAALPHPQHGDNDQGDCQGGKEQEEGSGGLRGYEQVAHDLDMLAETVRSIVTNVTQTLDGDDQDGSEENAGEGNGGADPNDDNAFEESADANEDDDEQRVPQAVSDAVSNHTASNAHVDADSKLPATVGR